MKKVLLTMVVLAMVAGSALALPYICSGTAYSYLGGLLGAGYTVTVVGHTNCYGVTDANGAFLVTGSPIPDAADHYLKFTKTGYTTQYSNWFYYPQNYVQLGSITLRKLPPPSLP
ncbi:MAG: hypothetical protein RDU76_00350 [Candidatus Edwardsbacteria bacterium]|nr:hypothetical protein [Candidatus Edwardsbacteria bacterium]